MRSRRFGLKKLMASLFQSGATRPGIIGLERLEDRLLLTTVPTQATLAGFANNWWINNTGQEIGTQFGTPGADISLEQAWDITTGSKNVIVADLEDGVSFNNDELLPNLYTNNKDNTATGSPVGVDNDLDGFINDAHGWDFADGTNDPSTAPYDGTGTAVAGLVGAAGDTTNPIIGVAPNVTIMPFKILMDDVVAGTTGPTNSEPPGATFYDTNSLIAGLNYIAMRKLQFGDNIDVVVMNLYQIEASVKFNDLPLINALQRVTNAGIIIVSGAGDSGVNEAASQNNDAVKDILTEANDSRIIQVAATDNQDNLWADSNFGPTTVQLGAPGVNIPVMAAGATTAALGLNAASSTAYSAGLVAGVLALEKSAAPGASADQLVSALLKGVDPVLGLTGDVSTGGRLNALRSVQYAIGDQPAQGAVNIFTNSLVSGFAFDTDSVPNSIQVELLVNGNVVSTQTANAPTIINGTSNTYGFNFTGVTALTNAAPGPQQVTVEAIDPISGKATVIKSGTLDIRNENFVTHLYGDMLARQPDTGGLDFWATLVQGGLSRVVVADDFAHSAEYTTNYVDGLYLKLLNSAPDPVNVPFYITELQTGLATQESIENNILSSAAFFTAAGGTDQTWVAQLYQTLLGRAGSAGDINGWVNSLITHTQQQVVNGFLFSLEYRQDQVRSYYNRFLDRNGSAGEVQGWASSGLGLLQVQEGFLGSQEYYQRTAASKIFAGLAFTTLSQTITAGAASGPITVLLLAATGNPVNAPAGGVVVNLTSTSPDGTFLVNGGPATTVTIAAGTDTATFTYQDTLAGTTSFTPGTPTITAATAGLTSATQIETVNAAAPNAFVFLTAPQTLLAGQASAPITVELKDAFGNVAAAGVAGQIVNLGTSSAGGSFLSLADTTISTFTMAAGTSTASFEYVDDNLGTPSIAVSAPNIAPTTQQETINPGVPTQLGFVTASQNLATGADSHTITVEVLDAFGHASAAGAGGLVINLATNSAGGSFVNLADTPITSITLTTGQGTASFKYTDTLAGTPTITVSSTGLTSALQGETVTAPVATALGVTTAAQTLTAGVTSGTITVQLQDQSGNPFNAPLGGTTVNLATSSGSGEFLNGATPITSVTIAAGTNTANFTYNDTLAGTPTLTLTSAGLQGTTQQETVNAAAASQIVFTTAAQTNLTVGVASAPITVELKDQFGNVAIAGVAGQAITLGTTSVGGTFSPTTATVAAGASTTSFTYTDTVASTFSGNTVLTPTITASAAGLTSAMQIETVFPLAAVHLGYVTSPQTLTAGVASATITVELLDMNNAPTTARTGGTTITLSTTSLGGTFSTGTTITIPVGVGTASFTYTDTVAGTPTVTAAATGLTSATQQETVNAAAPAQIGFTSTPVTTNPNVVSGAITVSLEDQFGNAVVNTGGTITVNLSSTSLGGTFTDTGGVNTITSVTIANGASAASFKYDDTTIGTPTVTAAATGLTSGTQVETVQAFAASQLVFLTPADSNINDPGAPVTPALSNLITVQLQDSHGNPVNAVGSGTVITLTAGGGSPEFTDGNGNVITTVTVKPGTSTASFRYTNGVRLNGMVTASATGLTSATLMGEDMSAVGITFEVLFTSAPQTLTSGVMSNTITIELVNDLGVVTAAPAGGLLLNLASTSNIGGTSTGQFFVGGVAATSVTVAAGASTATFTYEDTAPSGATPIISASGTAVTTVQGTQQETMM